MKINTTMLYPVGVYWIIFLVNIFVFVLAGKLLKIDGRTKGALMLTCGLGNTSFVGFPVLRAMFGEEAIKTGIVIDQAGTFFVLSTLGILVASYYSSGKTNIKSVFAKIIEFPPFIVFLISIILNILNYEHQEPVKVILEKLGGMIYVLALVSVGMQIRFDLNGMLKKEFFTGLGYKLIIAPLLIFVFYVYILGAGGEVIRICIAEAAMPPIIMGAVVASNFNLNPRLSSLLACTGIPVSFITLYFWYLIIKGL